MEAYVPCDSDLTYKTKTVNLVKVCVYSIAFVNTTFILFWKDDFTASIQVGLYMHPSESPELTRLKWNVLFTKRIQSTMKQSRRPPASFLGNSDVELDNVPILLSSTS